MDKELLKTILNLAKEPESNDECVCEQGLIKIVILQRGWVFIGKYFEEGENCRLEDANCIRAWGTTKGLGELASDGPQSNTKLDPTPTVNFHKLTIICSIDVDQKVWSKKLR